MDKRRMFGTVAVLGIFMAFMTFILADTNLVLEFPQNATNISGGSSINFNCSVDSNGYNISKVEFYGDFNKETFSIFKTFSKGTFLEHGIGGNISIVYLNEMNVTINPTYIIDGGGRTCNGTPTYSNPCNMFNTSTSLSSFGGYWVGDVPNNNWRLTFNDTLLMHNFYLKAHPTFYANYTTLEYSLDNVTWTTIINKSTTNIVNETFSTPIYAKYLRYYALQLNNNVNLYVEYMNITGQVLNTSVPFNSSLNYSYSGLSPGRYKWACKSYTGEGEYISVNNTFVVNGTMIDWVSPTPNSGTQTTNIVVKTQVTSDKDSYSFLIRNNSLNSWYTFDNSANRLASMSGFGNTFTATGTVHYQNLSTFGSSIVIPNGTGNYVTSTGLKQNDNGFTVVWTMNLSNSTGFDAAANVMNLRTGTPGAVLSFQSVAGNNTHWFVYVIYYNSTGSAGWNNALAFSRNYAINNSRFAVSADFQSQIYKLFINGALIDTKTSSGVGNFYDTGTSLKLATNAYTNISYDDVLFFNLSVTTNEGILLSNYSKVNNLVMDYSNDINVTLKPYGYDNSSVVTYDSTRFFNFLVSPVINYTSLFNKNNNTIYAYCRAYLNGTPTSSLQHLIQYSLDNVTWTNITNAYQSYQTTAETYAVIGDSMSTNNSGWVDDMFNLMGLTYNEVPSYAVPGWTCNQTYMELVQNVSDDTTHLFATCGVNGAVPEYNPTYWELIYNEAKAKNISYVHMTTMPPWDWINEQPNASAQTYCNRQKQQNQWLLEFDELHDDLFVYDLWADWHDSSGQNITDCGWRTDIVYQANAAHPNALGYAYWANRQWESINKWTNNTFKASISPIQSGEYYFRCYTDGDRQSRTADMEATSFFERVLPGVTINSPGSNQTFTTSSVLLNITLNENGTCLYSADAGATNNSMDTANNLTFIKTATFSQGSHTINFYCNDSVGNRNDTESVNFIITLPAASIEELSSSGAGGSPTYYPSEDKLAQGYEIALAKNYQTKFNLGGNLHILEVNGFGNETANITISSEPINFILQGGQTKKVDVNFDGTYDLSVFLKSISGGKANLVLTLISEAYGQENTEIGQNNSSSQIANDLPAKLASPTSGNSKTSVYTIIGIILSILIILGAILQIARKRK